jgi:hypothetical protein
MARRTERLATFPHCTNVRFQTSINVRFQTIINADVRPVQCSVLFLATLLLSACGGETSGAKTEESSSSAKTTIATTTSKTTIATTTSKTTIATTTEDEINLVGVPVGRAKVLLAEAGWVPRREDADGNEVPAKKDYEIVTSFDADVLICTQERFKDPDGGVSLWLRALPVCEDFVVVPNVVGKYIAEAEVAAETVRLTLFFATAEPYGAPSDWIVCSQDLPAGAKVNRALHENLGVEVGPPGGC